MNRNSSALGVDTPTRGVPVHAEIPPAEQFMWIFWLSQSLIPGLILCHGVGLGSVQGLGLEIGMGLGFGLGLGPIS